MKSRAAMPTSTHARSRFLGFRADVGIGACCDRRLTNAFARSNRRQGVHLSPREEIRTSLRRLLRCSILLVLAAALTGCFSAKNRVAKNFRDLQYQWQTNVARHATLPEQTLTWNQAVDLLDVGNLKLRQTRN